MVSQVQSQPSTPVTAVSLYNSLKNINTYSLVRISNAMAVSVMAHAYVTNGFPTAIGLRGAVYLLQAWVKPGSSLSELAAVVNAAAAASIGCGVLSGDYFPLGYEEAFLPLGNIMCLMPS